MRKALVRPRTVRQAPPEVGGCPMSLLPKGAIDVFRAFDAALIAIHKRSLDIDMTRMIREGEELENQEVAGATIRTL